RIAARLFRDRADPPLIRGVRGGPLRDDVGRIPPGRELLSSDRLGRDDAAELRPLSGGVVRSTAVRLRRRAADEDLTAALFGRFGRTLRAAAGPAHR